MKLNKMTTTPIKMNLIIMIMMTAIIKLIPQMALVTVMTLIILLMILIMGVDDNHHYDNDTYNGDGKTPHHDNDLCHIRGIIDDKGDMAVMI